MSTYLGRPSFPHVPLQPLFLWCCTVRVGNSICKQYIILKVTFLLYPFNFYHPPTELREGNVFSRVCLSMGGGSHDHYPWCLGPDCTGPAHYWHLVAITKDLIQTCSLEDPPPPPEHLMVCKRAVRILLKCFLVSSVISQYLMSPVVVSAMQPIFIPEAPLCFSEIQLQIFYCKYYVFLTLSDFHSIVRVN